MTDCSNMSYEEASNVILAGAKQLVQTALLFDALHDKDSFVKWNEHGALYEIDNNLLQEVEADSIQLVMMPNAVPEPKTFMLRNLHELTQQVFGFRFSPQPQISKYVNSDEIHTHLCLLPTELNGAHLGADLVSTHLVFASFFNSIEATETDEEAENYIGASLAFQGVSIVQRSLSLQYQQRAASLMMALVEDLDNLDFQCKISDDFSPYMTLPPRGSVV